MSFNTSPKKSFKSYYTRNNTVNHRPGSSKKLKITFENENEKDERNSSKNDTSEFKKIKSENYART